MKIFPISLIAAVSVICISSCSNNKEKESTVCMHIYNPPVLNFQVISQTNNDDFFFSSPPLYSASSDIKVYFRNDLNKLDSITPPVIINDSKKHFSFSTSSSKASDTCYVKIKNLKVDTLIYAVTIPDEFCPQPYISKIMINKAPSVNTTSTTVIQIKK
ncbi:hypothetical protein [Arcticibacter svalbardensis]|uniref:hypothetical protein n=1 Tax=Arcticibacter svalbardensis TaxID=1288027 RepID=UPI00058E74EE|nr:hypothetical protein [Arcticibacter svalbardensis]